MKKLFWLSVGLTALWLGACSPSKKEDHATREAMMLDSIRKAGPQRMQFSEVKSKVTFQGKTYESTVVRRPDESLPVVTNEQGESFMDNRITLRLTQGGKVVLDKVFTKESFASLVNAKILKYAILEGLVLDGATPQGIVYAASVGYPQTDLYVPLRITVSSNGKISLAKEELMDDWHETEQ